METTSKGIQKRLQETVEIYQQMLDAMKDMILLKGPKSHIQWANKAFREYYGMSNDQLRDLIDAPFSEPDYTQQYVRDDAYVFETGKTLDIPSEPVKRYDGVVRHYHTVKSPIVDSQGKVIMTVGVSRDVEDRERMEAMLRQTEKLSAMGQLAAGIAHEINNPLSIILGFAEAALKDLDAQHPLHGALHAIHRESIRCRDLVQNLLSFSRQRVPGFKEENPIEVLSGALALIEAQARIKGVIVHQDYARDMNRVRMDRQQIEQVLINLCSNALDAMSKGGRLSVFSSQTTTHWIIQIVDTGSGIPVEIQNRIFEPFFTTKDVGKGTGLGLPLAHDIVQRHQGEMEMTSHMGKGTTFIVRLPLKL